MEPKLDKWIEVIAVLQSSGRFTFDQARMVGIAINALAEGDDLQTIKARAGELAWKTLSDFEY